MFTLSIHQTSGFQFKYYDISLNLSKQTNHIHNKKKNSSQLPHEIKKILFKISFRYLSWYLQRCCVNEFDVTSICYTRWPNKNGTVDTVDFSGLCSDQQLFFCLPCWIEHLFSIIITPRSSNLVENFNFMSNFLWTVILGICPISRVPGHD